MGEETPISRFAGGVARSFLTLGGGEALARLVAFATTVYLARTLGAGPYGVISLATAVTLYFTYIVDCGIEMLGVREIAEDPARVSRLVPAVLSTRLGAALAASIVISAAGVFILPQPEGAVLGLYSLTLFWVAANTRWVHLGLQQARPVALSRVLGECLVFASVVLVVHAPRDLARIPLAQFAGDGLAALFLLWRLRALGFSLPWRFDWATVRPLFRRAGHLMLNSVLGLMIFNADLILLRVFRDSATVGYYGVAYTLVSFLLNLGIAYSLSLLPAITRASSEPAEHRALYDTASVHVLAVALPVAVGGALLAPGIIGFFFGPRFDPASAALMVLLGSIPVAALRNVPQAALIAGQRQELVLRTTALSAGLNLVLNLVLIPPYGMIGAALATGLTETARTCMTIWYCKLLGLSPRGLFRGWRPVVAAIAMAAVLLLVRSLPIWSGIPLGAAVYFLALMMLGGIRRGPSGWPVLAV